MELAPSSAFNVLKFDAAAAVIGKCNVINLATMKIQFHMLAKMQK